jgi:hypothetical protein
MGRAAAACNTIAKFLNKWLALAMTLLSRLNAKFGRYGVANVTMILIAGQVLLYVVSQLNVDPNQNAFDILDRVRMYPDRVLAGEWWRLITFLFDPPGMNVIFAFFFWYLLYMMGTTLEVNWGAFRYNVFLLVGYLASIACAFGAYFALGPAWPVTPASSGFLYGTVFLAFARLYPDFTMFIFFVLPVKIRWLALLQWIGYGWMFLFGGWMMKAMVLASVANYLLFFGRDIWLDIKHGHRRMLRQAQSLRSPQRIVHTCRVCGLTSEDAPQMQFRYCSKCEGDACYCAQHLRDHQHVTTDAAAIGENEKVS